jgi:hypothetical protein
LGCDERFAQIAKKLVTYKENQEIKGLRHPIIGA